LWLAESVEVVQRMSAVIRAAPQPSISNGAVAAEYEELCDEDHPDLRNRFAMPPDRCDFQRSSQFEER
jgi:hypothetical protein